MMQQPYPTYPTMYPNLNAANAWNQAAIWNRACPPCSGEQPPGGYTAISPEIANPPARVPEGAGMTAAPTTQSEPLPAINDFTQGAPITADSLQYLNGFIRTQIGRQVRVEFLVGTNTMTDRTGTLVAVGANYILINETETDDLLACDFYNIKFIKFYY